MQQRLVVWVLVCMASVLLSLPMFSEAQSGCRRTRANFLGVDRAPIVVGATVVQVAPPNTARCALALVNESSNDAYCADVSIDPVPTSTTGVLIKGNGRGIGLGTEGAGDWRCIRAGGVDATLNVLEGLP